MQLCIKKETGCIWLEFSEDHPWYKDNFFKQVDDISAEIDVEYEQRHLPLVFDFLKVTKVDSMFAAILVRALRAFPTQKMAIFAVDANVVATIVQLGLDVMIPVFSDKTELLHTLGIVTG